MRFHFSGFRTTLQIALIAFAATAPASVYGQGAGRGAAAVAKAQAPIDLTGYWVSVVTQDWRYRMVTPAKGDLENIPVTAEAARVAGAWDPAADEAAGNQCKSYGAPAIMALPARLHITWQDDNTLRMDIDAGNQTRLLRFGAAQASAGPPSWQGDSVAQWQMPGGGRGAQGAPKSGALKVVTRNLRAGYLRKNGVPYSDKAVVTDYFDVFRGPDGQQWLVVSNIVEDPQYLSQPYFVNTQFRKQADATGWDPTPCSTTW